MLGVTNARLAATGLATGDFIFTSGTNTDVVYRCEISPANPFGEFKSMNSYTSTGYGNTGLVYTNGILYALSSNGSASYLDRTLIPTKLPTHTQTMWSFVGPTAAAYDITPSALKYSASMVPGEYYVYAVNTAFVFPGIYATYYFQDNVATAGPTLNAPTDGTLVQILSPLTGSTQAVNFSWNRISYATAYEIQIALDSAFLNLATTTITVTLSTDPVSYVLGSTNSPLLAGNTYYWRIRASAPLYSAWSEIRTLTVQPTAASVPTVSSPVIGSNTVQPTGAAFSWTPVSGATMYKFELSVSPDFATTVYTIDAANAGASLPGSITLTRGKTYFWRVKSLTPVESDWSTVANFIVAELAPTTPPPPAAITTQIVITQPAATTNVITIPPATKTEVNPGYIWAIIIIGAVLVIAVIVLIVRTRRSV
jgi:hypothetical protein